MATLSAKEAARELGTDARTLRKFMRAITPKEDQPGQGNRYHIEKRAIPGLKKKFAEWSKPKAKPASNGVAAEELEVIDGEVIADEAIMDEDDLEIDDEVEPTDEDIEAEEEDFDPDSDDFDLEEI